MAASIRTVIYPVSNLDQAKAMFGALIGTSPVMDEPYYVQFKAGELEVGLDPNGAGKGMTGPVSYWHVDDIQAAVKQLLDAGASEQEPVHDVGGGHRQIATMTDASGNPIGLLQQG